MARKKAKPDEQPKRPRSRKKKDVPVEDLAAEQPPEVAQEQPAEQPTEAEFIPDAEQPQEPEQPQTHQAEAEAPATLMTPAAEEPKAELQGAPRRKSGRRPWDINLGPDEHVWERVESPGGEIIFRFKNHPTEAQMALVERYGFLYDEQRKEAARDNDPTGRVQADKLCWYLRQHQQGHQEQRSVSA